VIGDPERLTTTTVAASLLPASIVVDATSTQAPADPSATVGIVVVVEGAIGSDDPEVEPHAASNTPSISAMGAPSLQRILVETLDRGESSGGSSQCRGDIGIVVALRSSLGLFLGLASTLNIDRR